MSKRTAQRIEELRGELEQVAHGKYTATDEAYCTAIGFLLLSYHAEEWLECVNGVLDEEPIRDEHVPRTGGS